MKHIKVSPAAAAIPQPCKSPYEVARDAAMRAGHDETFRQLHGAVAHDPATCPWCQKSFTGKCGPYRIPLKPVKGEAL